MSTNLIIIISTAAAAAAAAVVVRDGPRNLVALGRLIIIWHGNSFDLGQGWPNSWGCVTKLRLIM